MLKKSLKEMINLINGLDPHLVNRKLQDAKITIKTIEGREIPFANETERMLEELPIINSTKAYTESKTPNAFVGKDQYERIGIYINGGWLGAKIIHFEGDCAPFAGG